MADEVLDYMEPWRVDDEVLVLDRAGAIAVDMQGSDYILDDDQALAERIVACVNFCRGVSTEALHATQLARVLDSLKVTP